MEINQLCLVLQAATSPDVAQRTAAEQTLKQYQHAVGHMTSLLRVAVEESLDPSIRQVAAITFKNLVKKDWDPADGSPSPLPEQDKAQVKENLLEGIIRTPPLIRSQLGECAKFVAYSDFPEKWPALLPSLCSSLGSPQQPRLWGALYVLRILARKYEFKDEEERTALEPVISATFPALLNILQGLIALDSGALEVADLLKLCLKIFWSASYMEVPAVLLQPEPFAAWMTAFHTLVVRPVPTVGQPEDSAERSMWVWWKTKKWVIHITQRLVSRYGDPRHCREGTDKAFCQIWVRDCAHKFLEAHLALISQLAEGQYLSPRVTNLTLNYLQHAMKMAASWKLLKPHVPALLQHVLFPLMCFSDEDQQLWAEDPHEYVRKGYDIIEEMYSPKSAAANFVHELCSTRPKGNLEALMHQVVAVFGEYQAAVAAVGGQGGVPQECSRRLDGALLAVGSLAAILKAKAPYKNQLEPMLVQYVQPLFAAPAGHLRAKAAWVSGTFADIHFSAGRGTGAHFNALFQANVMALRDSELPVRVDAVVALRGFVDAFSEEEVAAIKPLIPQLLDEFFQLMNEVDNDDLVGTLETIVEKFDQEMAPYAAGLCQHLVAAFWRILAADDKENEGDDAEEYGPLAAFGCLRALSTVLDTVSSLPHLIPQLEAIVFPVLKRLVSSEGQDVLEEVMELLAYFTYYSPTLSDAMWSLWPQLHEVVLEFGIEYFDSALMPFDNFISRGTDHFLSCKSPDYLASVNEIVEKTLSEEEYEETDVQAAPKLMEVVLQNCKGRVDQCVGPYLALSLHRLPVAETAYMKDLCMNVVASAFIYNAELAMGQLLAQGAAPAVFVTWCGMIATKKRNGDLKHFRRMYDKKVQALGLMAILVMREAALPAEVAGALDRLLAGAMVLLGTLKEQQEMADEDEEDDDVDDDESDGEEGGDGAIAASPAAGEDEDLADDEDEDDGYLGRASRARSVAARHHEESDDDEGEWTEEEDASTPLDPIDPFIAFADTLEGLRLQDPARLQAVTAGLNGQMKAALQDLLTHAQTLKMAELQRQQQAPPA